MLKMIKENQVTLAKEIITAEFRRYNSVLDFTRKNHEKL